MSKNLIIGGHGIGDSIFSLQCGEAARGLFGDLFDYKLATRNEVFGPIDYFFKDLNPTQLPEELGTNNSILTNNLIDSFKESYDNIYYVIPDLLFRNPYHFDFKKFNLAPHVIKQTRLSLKQWSPKKKIYLGVVTMAAHHRYPAIKPLIVTLAKRLPDHEIYFPNVKKWGGEDLDWGDFSSVPDNVFIHENPDFNESLDHLKESCFGIFADNGPSHFAYHLGMPRIILDNFMGNPMWISRWREDPSESVPMDTNVLDLASIVESHIIHPQCSLIPSPMCKNPLGIPQLLGFKY